LKVLTTAFAIALTLSLRASLANDLSGPCAAALAQDALCEAANDRASQLMKSRHLTAIVVMQNVRTGSLTAFAASDPAKIDITSQVLPLSTVKLLVAASFLDHEQSGETHLPDSARLLDDSIVNGNDDAGRQIALALRKTIGTQRVLQDLKVYGFGSSHSLDSKTADKDWQDTLSIGEERFAVTARQLSQFLQAVGNNGAMLQGAKPPKRILGESAARKLQTVMRGAVERGTARSAAPILADTGWQMGGKTGTGPDVHGAPGPTSDGWFAGLIFDQHGKARFTVATFVKHGGLGGGNAAWLSAELAKFISGNNLGL
jgi:membrane peptidoglycan carboxypeptidase